jgi:hypothetical protein
MKKWGSSPYILSKFSLSLRRKKKVKINARVMENIGGQ